MGREELVEQILSDVVGSVNGAETTVPMRTVALIGEGNGRGYVLVGWPS